MLSTPHSHTYNVFSVFSIVLPSVCVRCELLPSSDPLEEGSCLTFWCSLQDLLATSPCYFLLRGKFGAHTVMLEGVVLFNPLIFVKATEAWQRGGNPFCLVLLTTPSAHRLLKPVSCPCPGAECFLIVSYFPVHTWVCVCARVCVNFLNILYLFLRCGN